MPFIIMANNKLIQLFLVRKITYEPILNKILVTPLSGKIRVSPMVINIK